MIHLGRVIISNYKYSAGEKTFICGQNRENKRELYIRHYYSNGEFRDTIQDVSNLKMFMDSSLSLLGVVVLMHLNDENICEYIEPLFDNSWFDQDVTCVDLDLSFSKRTGNFIRASFTFETKNRDVYKLNNDELFMNAAELAKKYIFKNNKIKENSEMPFVVNVFGEELTEEQYANEISLEEKSRKNYEEEMNEKYGEEQNEH